MSDSAAQPADATEAADEAGSQFFSGPVVVQKKLLILGLAGIAAICSLLAAIITFVVVHSGGQDDVARLENSVKKLKEENRAALKQVDELRELHARAVAERRCDTGDGSGNCPAPAMEMAQPSAPGRLPQSGITANAALTESVARGPVPAGRPATSPGKLSLGEFAEELSKIPGVAVDGTLSPRTERPPQDKR